MHIAIVYAVFMTALLSDFPLKERPRERLFNQGVSSLSDAELVSVLLRSGGKGMDAIALSRKLLSLFGDLSNLVYADVGRLQEIKFLGDAKISSLLSVGEICRRILEHPSTMPVLDSPRQIFSFVLPKFLGATVEKFYVLCLDAGQRFLHLRLMTTGTDTQALVDLKDVVRVALIYGASSIVLIHNHPSGRLSPSDADLLVTRRIQRACYTLGITFLDHIIVSSSGFFSFRQSEILNFSEKGGD